MRRHVLSRQSGRRETRPALRAFGAGEHLTVAPPEHVALQHRGECDERRYRQPETESARAARLRYRSEYRLLERGHPRLTGADPSDATRYERHAILEKKAPNILAREDRQRPRVRHGRKTREPPDLRRRRADRRDDDRPALTARSELVEQPAQCLLKCSLAADGHSRGADDPFADDEHAAHGVASDANAEAWA
jgi:hypothetical protein